MFFAIRLLSPELCFSYSSGNQNSMKKMVVKLNIQNTKEKRKALKAVCKILGVESITVDMKEKKLTIIGDIDPVLIMRRFPKHWHANIESVGPKEEPKKEVKKEEPKKEEPKKTNPSDHIAELARRCKEFNPCNDNCYIVYHYEEPNPCKIL